MEHKFKNGEVVLERIRPSQKLIVRDFERNVYYCQDFEYKKRKELTFFERELMAFEEVEVGTRGKEMNIKN